jgi:membrane protease YdiL (CAAX protease family)
MKETVSDVVVTTAEDRRVVYWQLVFFALVMLWVCGFSVGFRYTAGMAKFMLVLVTDLLFLGAPLWAWRRWHSGQLDVFSLKGGVPAWLFLFGMEGLIFTFCSPAMAGNGPLKLAGSFLYYLVLIALPEEIMWRGMWMRMWRNRPGLAVWGGSLIFGLYHWPLQGAADTVEAFGIGALLAVIRYRGCSLGPLILVHALFDLSGNGLFTFTNRGYIPENWFMVIEGLLCAAAGALMYFKPWAKRL